LRPVDGRGEKPEFIGLFVRSLVVVRIGTSVIDWANSTTSSPSVSEQWNDFNAQSFEPDIRKNRYRRSRKAVKEVR
jgi:hypothetical protein